MRVPRPKDGDTDWLRSGRGRRCGAASTTTGGVAGRCGFALAGWSTVILGDIFLVAFLEIGFVPAAALEPEPDRRNQLLQFWLAATRAVAQFGIAEFLQYFQFVVAGLTTVLVNRHGTSRKWHGTVGNSLALYGDKGT